MSITIEWLPSTYLNIDRLPHQEEIVKGKHKIIFWNDETNTFTNSRGPHSDYSFTGCLPHMNKDEAKGFLVGFLKSGKNCFNDYKRSKGL